MARKSPSRRTKRPVEHCDACGAELRAGDQVSVLSRQTGTITPLDEPGDFAIFADAPAACGFYCMECTATGEVDLVFEDELEDWDEAPGPEPAVKPGQLSLLGAPPDPPAGRGLAFLAVRLPMDHEPAVLRGFTSAEAAWTHVRDMALCHPCQRHMVRLGPSGHPSETHCGMQWLVADQDIVPEGASDDEVLATVLAPLREHLGQMVAHLAAGEESFPPFLDEPEEPEHRPTRR